MLKIDPMLHRKPGFIGLSFMGRSVFEMLLKISDAFDLDGVIPPSFWDPHYIASEFRIEDGGVKFATHGLEDAIKSGVVEKLAGDDANIHIVNWDSFLPSHKPSKKPKSGASPDDLEISRRWNEYATINGLVKVLELRAQRLENAKKADQEWNPVKLDMAFAKLLKSDFLMGKNDRKWQAGFDWFVRPGTIGKLLEGSYDNRGGDSPVKIVNTQEELYK